jgi:parallel beta-helix repeat protein
VLLEGSGAGDEKEGGAIEVRGCRETTLNGCSVFEPRYRGLYIRDSRNTSVTGCTVLDRGKTKTMREAGLVVGRSGTKVIQEGVIVGERFAE